MSVSKDKSSGLVTCGAMIHVCLQYYIAAGVPTELFFSTTKAPLLHLHPSCQDTPIGVSPLLLPIANQLLDRHPQQSLMRVMGRMVNKEQTPSLQSKPNEGFQLHRPELLIAAAHGDSDEIKRLLLLLLHREEDAVEVVLDVEETNIEDTVTDIEDIIADDVQKPAAIAMPPSQAVTGAGDSVLPVVASSGDGDEFLECATVIVGKANHLLGARNRKGDTPLHYATRLRNARMVSRLLSLARAGDGTSDERDGASDERVKVILRMQNGKEETVLHEAIRLENKEMIGVLLSADSQLAGVPLTDGASPFYLALSLGHRDIARQLFEKDKELSYSGPDGQNALHAAIQWKWVLGEKIIEMLLERNKDLIKQADRSTRRTPLHFAALSGEKRVTELLLSADPSPAYLPDSNGSFPIHLAASNGQRDNVLALLQKKKSDSSKEQESASQLRCHGKVGRWLSRLAKSDSSKEQNISPYSAQLRDGKGRTFLHVAVKDERWAVVKHACQEQGKMFASSVMNMQDDDGNTALHLAVEVENVRALNALVSIPEIKLNLKNNKGQTPRELASSKVPKGLYFSYSSPPSRMYWLLDDAAHLTASPREHILPREIHNKKDTSQIVDQRTQIIGLGSVLITTVTFAAAFAVPGGYRADGTPTLAGQYAFDAFVAANTQAFIFSGVSIILLMFAGLGTESVIRVFSLLRSVNFLALSARSLGAAFALGMYAVLAPVEREKAIGYSFMTVFALLLVESEWGFRAVKTVYSDKVVLVKRFGISRAWWRLARPVLGTLMFEFSPYILIAGLGMVEPGTARK